MAHAQPPPVVLTIAGSDSSGGAGIQADLKTFTALKCYGASVVTALTAQNTTGVENVFAIPAEFVRDQLESILFDLPVTAYKTGMLHDASVIRAIVTCLKMFNISADNKLAKQPPIVVDPVCVSTSGHTLLEPEAVEVMIEELFPIATLITPNIAEAELILNTADDAESLDVNSIADAVQTALRVGQLCNGSNGGSVLLKGGHFTVTASALRDFCAEVQIRSNKLKVISSTVLPSNMEILRRPFFPDEKLVIDVLYEKSIDYTTVFARPHIDSDSTHGTGCTLSAAIACFLAFGCPLPNAVELATTYTHEAIERAFPLGQGNGPLNHLHDVHHRLISRPSETHPFPFTRLLIESNFALWKEYVEHPFVIQLGQGILDKTRFIHFIKQDYHYLKYYARAYGLLASKSRRFENIRPAVATIQNVLNEVSSHKAFCVQWGVSIEELENAPESAATTAYGAYLLDVGLHGDETKLIIALAACLLGYGEVGLWLRAEASKGPQSWVRLHNNPYRAWMEDYSGVNYQQAVQQGIDILERVAQDDPPSPKRLQEWKEVWAKCTLLEKNFWDMAMNLS